MTLSMDLFKANEIVERVFLQVYILNDFSLTIPGCYNFFPHTARLWNPLPIACFPLTYDINGFKSRINRHLLTVGSF